MKLLILSLTLILAISCNPCKRLSKKMLKHPECLNAMAVRDTIRDTIQGDTIEFWATLDVDTAKLLDSIRLVLQNGDGDLSPIIKLIPSAIKIKPFTERNDKYYALAYIENGQLKVFVETYPQIITTEVDKIVYRPEIVTKAKIKNWQWVCFWLLLFVAFVFGWKMKG